MKKFIKFMKWVLVNAFVAFCCYRAVITSEGWEFNLFRFFAWITFIVGTIAYSVDQVKDTVIDGLSEFHVNSKISGTYDLVMISFLIANGWFFTAIMLIIPSLLEYSLKDDIEKKKTK